MNAQYLSGRFPRHVAGIAVSVFVLLALCNFAHATVLAYDAFSYPNGNVNGCNGGTGWSNAWWSESKDSQATAMATPLTYTFPTGEVADGGPNVLLLDHDTKYGDFDATTIKRTLATPYSGDVVYASFLLHDDSPAIGKDMALMWLNGYNGPKFGMVGSSGPGKTSDFGAAAGKLFRSDAYTGDMALDQTYLVVARITKTKPGAKSGYNKIEMWINPTIDDQDTPDLTTYTTLATVSKITSIGFANTEKRSDTIYVDEAMLGTTWSDVTPGPGTPPDVPEPFTAGVLLAGGLAILRRNRRGKC